MSFPGGRESQDPDREQPAPVWHVWTVGEAQDKGSAQRVGSLPTLTESTLRPEGVESLDRQGRRKMGGAAQRVGSLPTLTKSRLRPDCVESLDC